VRGRLVRRHAVVVLLALGAGLAGAGSVAAGQDLAAETARWRARADALRLPLLAPGAPTGFALESMRVRRRGCGGEFLAEVVADYARADGARISLFQGYPAACADFGDVDDAGTTRVRGHPARFLWAGGGGPCFSGPEAAPCGAQGTVPYADSLALTWTEVGARVGFYSLFSNLIAGAPIQAFADTLVDVVPDASRSPLWVRERALVLGVTRGNRVRILAGGRPRVVSLAGISAPRTCRRDASLAFARRAMPRGRMVTLETDPTNGGGRARVFVYRSDRAFLGTSTVNHALVRAGLARVAPGRSRFRPGLVEAEREARRDDRGVFSLGCTAPPPPPVPVSTTPRPVAAPPPGGPGRGDA
jgi:endonuclease YncB( thermonuclease family)